MKSTRIPAIAVFLTLASQTRINAQIQQTMQDNREKTLTCADAGRSRGARFCEVREQTLASVGRLAVDPGRNGAVTVKGWLSNQVLVRSRVETWADSDSDAALLASRVQVNANTGQISASGPDSQGDSGWSASYEIFVPQSTDLDLKTYNGGITISDVRGRIGFAAHNGGVRLTRVAGDVAGATLNGAVNIELAGNTWDGRQLEVSTTNGGVTLSLPERYSAQLRTETANGRVRSELPPAAAGNLISTRNLEVTLGSGGPLIHVSTTNGGVTVKRL
jgi:DUF4097 and DUF4098 domain-containing protein YvlB